MLLLILLRLLWLLLILPELRLWLPWTVPLSSLPGSSPPYVKSAFHALSAGRGIVAASTALMFFGLKANSSSVARI